MRVQSTQPRGWPSACVRKHAPPHLLAASLLCAAGRARPSSLQKPHPSLTPPVSPWCHSLPPAGELLQQRASVAANVRRLVAGFREAEAADKAAASMPSYGSTVTVVSESQVGCCLRGAWGGIAGCSAAAWVAGEGGKWHVKTALAPALPPTVAAPLPSPHSFPPANPNT